MDRLNKQEELKEEQDMLDWLTPLDFSHQQSAFSNRQQKGTGYWLLDADKVKDWVRNHRQILFLLGMAGVGKTFLASIIVDYLEKRFMNDQSVGIAYLYGNFWQKHDVSDLLASLLRQLVRERRSVPQRVKTEYDRYRRKGTRPPLDELVDMLHLVAGEFSQVFIILDGLDEYQDFDKTRTRLLSEAFDLVEKAGANILAISRFIPEISKKFEDVPLFEIRATDNDIRKHLSGHMDQLPAFVSSRNDLQETIISTIVGAVNGV